MTIARTTSPSLFRGERKWAKTDTLQIRPKRKNVSSPKKIRKKQRSEPLETSLEDCDNDSDPYMPCRFSRMKDLLTRPESKASWKPMKKRYIKVPKSQLGKLSGMLDLPVDIFCEVRILIVHEPKHTFDKCGHRSHRTLIS